MAAFNKFNAFVKARNEGVHNFASDQLVVALTSVAPVATNSVLADLTQIAYTNLSSRNLTTASSSQTNGTYSLVVNDLTLTASGGAAEAFRYVVVYNDTAASDPLVGYFDRGSNLTLADGDSVVLDFGAALFTDQ